MSLKKISIPLAGAFLFILPVLSVAEMMASGITRSGELLQNNPMLHTPSAPRSKEKEEIRDVGSQAVEPEEHAGPTIYVKRINIFDVPPSSHDEVEKLLAAYRGKEMTLSALRNVAVTITELLQRHGEKLVFAYIPDQNIKNGIVIFKIFRGHIESVTLNSNSSLVSDAVVGRYIEKMEDIKGDANASEDYLSRLSDLPGVGELSSFLSPGEEPGGSALHLDLVPSPRVTGVAVFDNMGSVSSGRNRLGLQVNVNSPLGYGDRFQALAYASPDFLQINHDSEHGNTLIGRLSYDLPINGRGTRLGAAFSRVSYKLGGPVYSGLGDGYAEVASLYGSHPLIRGNERNLNLAFTADFKRIEDTFWGMNNTRTAPVLTLQITGDKQGSLLGLPNILQHDVSVSAGRLSNNDEWNGLDTRGHFVKLNADMKLLQSVTSGVYASVHVVGQQASKNLDGAEKISLGGPYAVRAYSNAIASADNAVLISPAINFSVPGVEGLSTELFYDYAKGKIQKFSPQSTKVSLAGYGVGLNYNFNSVAFINASYAWRKGETELISHQNKAMGWITIGFQF